MNLKNKLVFICFIWILSLSAQNNNAFFDKLNVLDKNNALTVYQKKILFDDFLKSDENKLNHDETAEVYYYFLKNFLKVKKIEHSIECAIQIQKIGNAHKDIQTDFYIKNDKNLVNLYYRNKDYYKVISSANSYISKYPESTIRLGVIYRILGNAYCDIGDFEKAILHYRKAIFTFKKENNQKEEGRTLINLLEVYVKLKTEKYSNEIVESIKLIDSINKHSKLRTKDLIIKSLNAGVFYDFKKEYSIAKNYYKNALNLSHSIEDSLYIFKSLNNLAIVSRKEDNTIEAKEIFEKAYRYSAHNYENRASLFNNLADVFKKEKQYQKAIQYYDKAIAELLQIPENHSVDLIKINDINLVYNKLDLFGYLKDKANALLLVNESKNDLDTLQEALKIYELVDKIIDVIYFESREDLSKLFWREQAANFYLNATITAFKLNRFDKVFYFIEKSKALLLLENVTEANAKEQAGMSKKLLETEFKLISGINNAEAQLSEYKNREASSYFIDSIKNQVFIKKKLFSDFVDSLETVSPRYHNYKKKITVFDSKMVQEKLKKNELLLQYKFTKDSGFLVVLSKASIHAYELKNTPQIHKNISLFKALLSKPFVNSSDSNNFREISNNLYEQLLPNFLNNSDRLRNKKLIIIPDAQLQSIPFEALVIDKNALLFESYLLNFCDINYAHSFSSLASLNKNKFAFNNAFFAINPSIYQDKTLTKLTTSKEEVDLIEKLFDTNILTHEAASKDNFIRNYGDYNIVHISTHGGIVNDKPWIAFNDQKLWLNDMYFRNQKANLVVLNACETSLGEYKKGEGVMSIARAFTNSGAKSVISSLWAINQKATNEIIFEFYKNIKDGQSKSSALRIAKLKYLETHKNTSQASPYFWSPIVLIGDDASIVNTYQNNWPFLIILFFVFLLSDFFLQNRFSKSEEKTIHL